MIEMFELTRTLSGQPPRRLTSRRRLIGSEDALALLCARLRFKGVVDANLSFSENQIAFDIHLNPAGTGETICMSGDFLIPETMISSLSNKPLTDLIGGSTLIDEVFSGRSITDCYQNSKLKIVRVVLEDSGGGWWFGRNADPSAFDQAQNGSEPNSTMRTRRGKTQIVRAPLIPGALNQ